MLLCYVALFPEFLKLLASRIFFHSTALGNSFRNPCNTSITSPFPPPTHTHATLISAVTIWIWQLYLYSLQPWVQSSSHGSQRPLGVFATLNTPIVIIMLLSAELLACARNMQKVSQMSISWLHRTFCSPDGGTLRTVKEAAF